MRKLGQGSFGEAYLGSNRKLDLACVIKIYTSKMMYIKMLREILLLQTVCGGPNIMKVYDVIRESTEGHPALILEYVQSSDAEVDAVYQSLSPADVQYYMKQLLIALAHVHKMEVIHRDVKPHNVLIDPQRRILRLIDFGLSVFHEPGPAPSLLPCACAADSLIRCGEQDAGRHQDLRGAGDDPAHQEV